MGAITVLQRDFEIRITLLRDSESAILKEKKNILTFNNITKKLHFVGLWDSLMFI